MTRTATSVVSPDAPSVVDRVRGSDTRQHPLHNLPRRTVYASGYAPLGKTHPIVKLKTAQ